VLGLETGDAAAAVQRARESAARAPEAPGPVDRAFCQSALGHACLAVGDEGGAEAAFLAARTEYALMERPQAVYEPDVGLAEVALRRGDLATATGLVAPLVEAVIAGSALDLADCAQPAALLLTAGHVLEAGQDARSDAFLRAGRGYLLGRARAIGDEAMAAGYLAKRSEAELLALAARSAGSSADILAVDGGPR
jgi:hypothetical protein